ncbi:MAG: type II toxin-antitoxin system RelE/ParE family toxin [Ferrovum myxofaciens]|uniref:Type II toxin-antitoxin system RelE/ParE family toxin n=1 Tax=Ferrovum myxofaciens TaxID=416213 RepID=A0A9E6MWT8_9PROT|nr:MAG: type II toxin-antitoxin system RelE/ParE family toxin [Ferrovum myxofaciens]QWY74462.1 MAG: type II toxin-antitoxin system RelE/ParE family toxin [Ferrovum myxofaciens]QWY77209.1 MAG: type II toxin-antitoxin system RelE/ParE family toxin [Ferrovum myxofaciens]
MSPVIYAPGAIRDLQRLQEFLRPKNPVAARRAADTIMEVVQMLVLQPQIGRPVDDHGPRVPGMADRLWRQRLCRALPLRW